MPSVVNDSCILCKACVEVCPVDAFREGKTQVVVSPEDCIDCGICITECPQGAIAPSDTADKKWVDFNAEMSAVWPKAKAG
ncbi:MAG: ferredoxin family protein [Lactobacillales bacterium]|nr:ferredoxin family protein [Lactobacillales bacterium]